MNDGSLIKNAKKGDKEALVMLVMNRRDEYYRLAYIFMRNKEDAMDVLQDMIVKLFENVHKLKRNEAFHSWAKTILVNICKGKLKKRNKNVLVEGIDILPETGDYDNSAAFDESLDLRQGLGKINKNQREALILKYFLDLDYKTIGEITKTPVGTVKSRVFNGLRSLKEILEGGY